MKAHKTGTYNDTTTDKMEKLYIFITTILLATWGTATHAQNNIVFTETFEGVNGTEAGLSPINMTDLDNKEGWTFNDVYSGPGCALIEAGGSVTLPAVPGLNGNACIYFNLRQWGNGKTEPCTLSLSEGGMNTPNVEMEMDTDGHNIIYNVTPETRITLTATNNVMLDDVMIWYGSSMEGMITEDFKISAPSGIYAEPLEVMLAPNRNYEYADNYLEDHLIMVYTTDGSKPTRFSTRYSGPITIDSTTTLGVGLISATGNLYTKQYEYSLPVTAHDIAAYRALPENTFTKLILNNALVTYSEIHDAKGDTYGHTYIQDESGAMGIVGWGGTPLKTNDILNGSIIGYTSADGNFTKCEFTSFDNLVTGTATPEPTVAGTIDEVLDDNNLNTLVTLTGVTVNDGYATKDGVSIKIVYAPTMAAEPAMAGRKNANATALDITGILQKADDEYQLMLISEPVVTSVGTIYGNGAAAPHPTAIYLMDGRKTDTWQRGMNIVRYSDGTVRKVITR